MDENAQFILGGEQTEDEAEELVSHLEKSDLHISKILCGKCELKELKKEDYYLFIAQMGIDPEIFEILDLHGWKEVEDYQYIYHDIRIGGIEGYYKDVYENEIIAKEKIDKCNVRFKGWNSKLYIGSKVRLAPDCEINIGSNCTVIIGEMSQIGSTSSIRCEDESTIYIGKNVRLVKGKMVSRNKIEIGDNCIFNEGFNIICEQKTEIIIGSRCLFSSNVHMRSGNGHSIFLLKEEENISQKAKHIIIEDHVWVGQDVTILHNAKIGKDSVVGAKSLVKKEHADSCLLYGVPAQTKQNNVRWDIRNISYEEYIGELINDSN